MTKRLDSPTYFNTGFLSKKRPMYSPDPGRIDPETGGPGWHSVRPRPDDIFGWFMFPIHYPIVYS
jgi:hypothetical protein